MSDRQAYDFEDLNYEEEMEDGLHLDGDDDFVYEGSGADQDHNPDGVQDHHEETLPEEPSYVVPDVDVSSILCPEHKAKITPDCSRCEAVKAALPPDLLKQLRSHLRHSPPSLMPFQGSGAHALSPRLPWS